VEVFNINNSRDEVTGELRRHVVKYARAMFTVEEVVFLHSGNREPRQLFINIHVQDVDGGFFFTAGERYFVAGEFMQSGFMSRGSWRSMPSIRLTTFETSHTDTVQTIAKYEDMDEDFWLAAVFQELSQLPRADEFPMQIKVNVASEHTGYFPFALGEMTWEEALNSPMSNEIEEQLTTVSRNSNRLNILTTNRLNSFYMFNQHRANIEVGRDFTQEEYEEGARVVLIPRFLANSNGLEVGDTIYLHIFDGQYISTVSIGAYQQTTPEGEVIRTNHQSYRTWEPGGYTSDMRITEPIAFEIIGIYFTRNPRLRNDPQGIPLNVLFIPDGAFEGFEPLEINGDDRAESPLLNTIIIPNGKIEEFRRTINAMIPGYGNFFMFYDQGYAHVRAPLDNLLRNAWFIFTLCLAGWIVAAMVFCLFFVLRKKKETSLLYALGISRGARFRWVFVQCLIVIVIAQGATFFASNHFFDRIFEYAVERTFIAIEEEETTIFADAAVIKDGVALETEITQEPLAIPLATAASSVLLLCAAAGFAISISKATGEKR
jgi:hypothetical protein